MKRILLIVLCLTGVAVGCDCEPKPSIQQEEQPEQAELRPSKKLQALMKQHAQLAIVVRDALIRGEPANAQTALASLADLMETSSYPGQGEDYARAARAVAAQARRADTLEETALAFAALSQRCGECHHALNRGPPMKLDPVPEGRGLAVHMRRHDWAVQRMWEALLSDSPSAFKRAATALADAPLHGTIDPDFENPPGVSELADRVHDLAFSVSVEGEAGEDTYVPAAEEPGEKPPSTRSQSEVYGLLLTTCSQCHRLLDVTPALEGR
jgi:hypothetical protein